ncbi:Uncharacterized protein HI_1602 [Chlamydiales bacterium SCGC AG-110-M15]|nr:Uncharacterized protein HI_1602 [Chlamydiales bacterium SCGC AG-110-M15]
MNKMCELTISFFEKFSSLSSLFFRLILAYGFYEPAMKKLGNIEATAQWFDSMNFIYPIAMAWAAGLTEGFGVILLFFGLATRFISIPLMFVMVVAITTVHWDAGFNTSGGYEIPVYYFLMLFSLFARGAGCFSLDAYFCKKY